MGGVSGSFGVALCAGEWLRSRGARETDSTERLTNVQERLAAVQSLAAFLQPLGDT